MKPMATDGGPHPADKWADVTTDTLLALIQIADNSESPAAVAARQAKRDLRPVLFALLHDHLDGVQRTERSKNSKVKDTDHALERRDGEHDPDDYESTEEVCGAVCAALAATPFAAHFAQPEVDAVVHRIIKQHTVNAMNIERRWHHDRLTAAKGA